MMNYVPCTEVHTHDVEQDVSDVPPTFMSLCATPFQSKHCDYTSAHISNITYVHEYRFIVQGTEDFPILVHSFSDEDRPIDHLFNTAVYMMNILAAE
jgi:hypothetical protein